MGNYAATERSRLVFNDGQEQPIAEPVLTGLGAQTVKADGSPVLNEGLQVIAGQFAPSAGDVTPGIPAGAFIFAGKGSISVKAEGLGVLHEGDESAPVVVIWANNPGNGISTRTASVICKIQSAGQSSVKAE
jgi:hypothetical protein